jgi:fructokinase
METWVSGTGLANDFNAATGLALTGREVVARAEAGDAAAGAAFERFQDRLARGLAHIINVLDPDVVVLGGGMSNVLSLYERIPPRLPRWVFGGEVDTPIRRALHGDSSGVRGAAWLWPAASA